MKRYFKTITAVVLAALTTAACQKENFGDATPAGQEVDVALDLLAPQIGTKSYGDGTTAKTVYVHVYQQDAHGNLTYIEPAAEDASLKTPSQSLTLSGLKATYSTRLVTGQTYTFVFWAQADKAPYTYDTDAKTITVNYASAKGNDESRDAFYNVLPNVKIEGAYTASVQLARPFAQLNFGAADYEEAKAAGLTVTKAMVKLTHAATSLNLLDGTTAGDATVTFASAALPADPNDILKAGGKDYKYVAMDYVLVGKSAKTLSDVTLTLTLTATGTHSTIPKFTYSNVPLQANYRTNIVGNLFTSPAEVNITVDPAFDTPAHNVYPELLAVAANGGSITLSEDVELSEPLVIAAGKDAVINLNGKTINFKGGKDDAHCFAFRVKGSLTIEGNGTIDGGDDVHTERNIVWANGADAKVTIKGGTFKMGKNTNGTKSWYDCIYANDGAKVEIYGGTFQNDCEGRPQSLNIQNSGNKASILVYGGNFVNYDPSTGDDSLGGNFVADGYASVTASANPFTYKVVKATKAENAASIDERLNNGETVVVAQSFELNNDTKVSAYKSATLKLEGGVITTDNFPGKNITDAVSVANSAVLNIDGNGTINGPVKSDKSTSALAVRGRAKLNIYGNLVIDGGSSSAGNNAIKLVQGTANIYGGYFHSGNDAKGKASEVIYLECGAYTTYKSTLNIYGGVFECDGDASHLINCYDAAYRVGNAKVNICGGTFVGFNPADNTAEGEHTNFVAPGYKSVETTYNGKQAWTVVAE